MSREFLYELQFESFLIFNFKSGGADFIFIPEKPPTTMPWEDAMCDEIHRVRFTFVF